uniref:Uncharacterized protein n=1 Tax=Clytia hemisphaerica TaxID=252671 RepID=A0A7M5UPU1_9CNID
MAKYLQSRKTNLFNLKTLLLKSLTKVEELDIKENNSTSLLKKYVYKEWNVPEHLQMLMHNGQEIGRLGYHSFNKIFQENATTEERENGILNIHLISKQPRNLTIILTSSYSQSIDLPDAIVASEVESVADIEKRLSEITSHDICVYSTTSRSDEFTFPHPKSETALYTLVNLDIEETLVLDVFRRLTLNISTKCKKCDVSGVFQREFIIRGTSTDVKYLITLFSLKLRSEQCQDGFFCKKLKLRLADDNFNRGLSKKSILVNLPANRKEIYFQAKK